MKKIIALLMALLMVGAVLAACGKTADKPAATDAAATQAATAGSATADSAATVADLEKVQKAGKLIVGITDFEPMDYQKDGKWIGFDADMATKFAESLGVKAEFVEIDWDNKALELKGGSIDCVWNGMTLTPEVTSAMSCTNAYLNNAQVVGTPGEGFGACGKGYFRLTSFGDRDNTIEAVERIKKLLK